MGKCDCYHTRESAGDIIYGICSGTKGCEICSCKGETSRCDFYPEKRKKANKMLNTAEMWLKAQRTGKVYKYGDSKYSKKSDMILPNCMTMDELMSWTWEESTQPTMTRKEAEEKFGVEIID